MLILAIRLRQRGWDKTADFLIELSALFAKLGRADRTIRRARKRRQNKPPVPFVLVGGDTRGWRS